LAVFLKNFKALDQLDLGLGNKLIVRLARELHGEEITLAREIEKARMWNWEKYFDAGFLSHYRLRKSESKKYAS